MYLETKEERFRSEMDLSISVCWVFSVCQVISRIGQGKKNMSGIIDCLKLLK